MAGKQHRAQGFCSVLSDAAKFIVHDAEKEKNFGFNLVKSLNVARESGGMLLNCEVHVTKSVKPDPSQMQGTLCFLQRISLTLSRPISICVLWSLQSH